MQHGQCFMRASCPLDQVLTHTSLVAIFLQHFIISMGRFIRTYEALKGVLRIWWIAIGNFVFSDKDITCTSLRLSIMLDTSAVSNSSPLLAWISDYSGFLLHHQNLRVHGPVLSLLMAVSGCHWVWLHTAFVLGISKKLDLNKNREVDIHVILCIKEVTYIANPVLLQIPPMQLCPQ